MDYTYIVYYSTNIIGLVTGIIGLVFTIITATYYVTKKIEKVKRNSNTISKIEGKIDDVLTLKQDVEDIKVKYENVMNTIAYHDSRITGQEKSIKEAVTSANEELYQKLKPKITSLQESQDIVVQAVLALAQSSDDIETDSRLKSKIEKIENSLTLRGGK